MATKVCVVGVGAIGGCVVGALARVPGLVVTAIARGATLETLRRDGLTLVDGVKEQRIDVAVSHEATGFGRQDFVIIATKGQAIPSLAPSLAPLLDRDTVVVPLLNGVPWWYFAHLGGQVLGYQPPSVDPGGMVSSHLPPDQVVGAVVHMSASSPAPGVVTRGQGNRFIVGDPSRRQPGAATQVHNLLHGAGFEVETSPEIHREVWYKLWGNLSFNPISALTRATADEIAGDRDVRALCAYLMDEAATVSERFGITIHASADDRIAVAGKLGRFKTSMLQDVEAGRRLEIAPLLGAVTEIAEHLGVSVPYTRVMLGLTRLLDRSLAEQAAGA